MDCRVAAAAICRAVEAIMSFRFLSLMYVVRVRGGLNRRLQTQDLAPHRSGPQSFC